MKKYDSAVAARMTGNPEKIGSAKKSRRTVRRLLWISGINLALMLIHFTSQASVKEHVSETASQVFDSTGLSILAVGALGTAAFWQSEDSATDFWNERRSHVPRPLLDTAGFFGSGVPTAAIIATQFFFDSTAAFGHLEGVLMAAATTSILKEVIDSDGPDGHDSFPSPRTAVAFATASSLSTQYGWQWGIPAYTLATMVGFEETHNKKNWLKDVLAGATIGVLAGRGSTKSWMKGKIAPMFKHGAFGVRWIYKF